MRLPIFWFILILIATCDRCLAGSESDVQLPATFTASVARGIQKRATNGSSGDKMSQLLNVLKQLPEISGTDINNLLADSEADLNSLIENILPVNILPLLHRIPLVSIITRAIEAIGGVPLQTFVVVLRLVLSLLQILLM